MKQKSITTSQTFFYTAALLNLFSSLLYNDINKLRKKNRQKLNSIELFHLLFPSTYAVSPIINIPHPSGAFVRIDEPTSLSLKVHSLH